MDGPFATYEHPLGLVFYGREKTCSALLEEVAQQAEKSSSKVMCLATGDFVIPKSKVWLPEHWDTLAKEVRFAEEAPATHTPIGWLDNGDTVDIAFGFCQGIVYPHLLQLLAAIPYPMTNHYGARLRIRGLIPVHADLVIQELAPMNFIFDENSPYLLPVD